MSQVKSNSDSHQCKGFYWTGREGLRDLISKRDDQYQVKTAVDGLDGLNKAQKYQPDIIITDIKMPKIDGIQMIAKIRELNIKSEILILSGYAEFEYAKSALSLGVVDYILKPVVPATVFTMLEKCTRLIQKSVNQQPQFQRQSYHLLSGTDNKMLSNFYKDLSIDSFLCIVMYSKSGSFFTPNWKSFFLGFKSCVLINVYDSCYLGIIHPSNDASARTILTKCQAAAGSSCTGIYRYLKSDPEINWYEAFRQLLSCIPWSISLNKDFFLFEEYMLKDSKATADSNEFFKKLKKCFYNQEYRECNSLIISFIKYLQDNQYHPDYIKMLAASCLLQAGSNASGPEFDHRSGLYVTVYRNELMAAKNFHELKAIIGHYYSEGPLSNKSNQYSKPVIMAINYIQKNFSQPISLNIVADKIRVTPQYLSRIFSKETNRSFIDYVTSYRINIAKQLLDTTDIKVFEIANRIGFSDAKYFCTLFKKYEGISPNQYRSNRNV